jgi:hypothetical protein
LDKGIDLDFFHTLIVNTQAASIFWIRLTYLNQPPYLLHHLHLHLRLALPFHHHPHPPHPIYFKAIYLAVTIAIAINFLVTKAFIQHQCPVHPHPHHPNLIITIATNYFLHYSFNLKFQICYFYYCCLSY